MHKAVALAIIINVMLLMAHTSITNLSSDSWNRIVHRIHVMQRFLLQRSAEGAASAVNLSANAVNLSSTSTPGCRDLSGKHVDFFYAFKYPSGWQYAYMDATRKLAKGDGKLGDGHSAVDKTLNQLYSDHSKYSYAMWNDEPPNKSPVKAPKAHAKGLIVMDKHQGFWLTHSIPLFPKAAEHAKSASSSFKDAKQPTYGQSFLCITFPTSEVSKIVKLFETDWMVIYDKADNAKIGGTFADWALNSAHTAADDKAHSTVVSTVRSKGGHNFVAFAKNAAFHKDLYEGLVASHFKKAFITETWQNGAGKLPTWCKGKAHQYTVENADKVKFPGTNGDWDESNDHSKWAVSEDGKTFCVGDINRQTGQEKRGGGTICIENAHIAKQMRDAITEVQHECKPRMNEVHLLVV